MRVLEMTDEYGDSGWWRVSVADADGNEFAGYVPATYVQVSQPEVVKAAPQPPPSAKVGTGVVHSDFEDK